MKLEDQVCSLELAKRLKELGVEQESVFCWSVSDFESMKPCVAGTEYASSIPGKGVECSAFTVAELGEMLPVGFYSERDETGWACCHDKLEIGDGADTEADARASMLVYLLENKIIKPNA